MNYEEKILDLFENGYLKTSKVVNENIPKIYLTRLIKKNKIERVGRGIYVKTNYLVDDFVVLQNKSKNCVFSNMTSLYLLGYSNRIPIKYDITVLSGYKGSLQKNNSVNLHYSKKENFYLGIKNYSLDSGYIIKIYDLEKTICDIIKNKKKLDLELYNKAIRNYFYSKEKNTLKLYDYARKMNIYEKVKNTFEVLM